MNWYCFNRLYCTVLYWSKYSEHNLKVNAGWRFLIIISNWYVTNLQCVQYSAVSPSFTCCVTSWLCVWECCWAGWKLLWTSLLSVGGFQADAAGYSVISNMEEPHLYEGLGLSSQLLHKGTWPRRTLRTPPSGWEPALVPRCSQCWASPCTERFWSSGDDAACDGVFYFGPFCSFLPERLKQETFWKDPNRLTALNTPLPFLSKQHERETNFYRTGVYLSVVGKRDTISKCIHYVIFWHNLLDYNWVISDNPALF